MAKAGKYRSKLRIYADILSTIDRDRGKTRITRLVYGANLPNDRLKEYLSELIQRGLVSEIPEEDHIEYALTQSGIQFLHELKRIENFTSTFGFRI